MRHIILYAGSTETKYLLKEGETYTVGREAADIKISSASVSRKHASIKIADTKVYITDLKSSNYTIMNEKPLVPMKETHIPFGVQLQFGKSPIFMLTQEIIRVTCTGLSPRAQTMLEKVLKEQDIDFEDKWSTTITHLVYEGNVCTKKFLGALVCRQYIVHPYFFTRRRDCANFKTPLPRERSCSVRQFKSDVVVDLKYEIDRSKIFDGQIAVVDNSEEHSKIGMLFRMAGGTVEHISNVKDDDIVNDKHYLPLRTREGKESERMKNIVRRLEAIGERAVSVQEICTAIINGDCGNLCQRNFNIGQHVLDGPRKQKVIEGVSLAADTQGVATPGQSRRASLVLASSVKEEISDDFQVVQEFSEAAKKESPEMTIESEQIVFESAKSHVASERDVTDDSKEEKYSETIRTSSAAASPTRAPVPGTPVANLFANERIVPAKATSKLTLKRKKPQDAQPEIDVDMNASKRQQTNATFLPTAAAAPASKLQMKRKRAPRDDAGEDSASQKLIKFDALNIRDVHASFDFADGPQPDAFTPSKDSAPAPYAQRAPPAVAPGLATTNVSANSSVQSQGPFCKQFRKQTVARVTTPRLTIEKNINSV